MWVICSTYICTLQTHRSYHITTGIHCRHVSKIQVYWRYFAVNRTRSTIPQFIRIYRVITAIYTYREFAVYIHDSSYRDYRNLQRGLPLLNCLVIIQEKIRNYKRWKSLQKIAPSKNDPSKLTSRGPYTRSRLPLPTNTQHCTMRDSPTSTSTGTHHLPLAFYTNFKCKTTWKKTENGFLVFRLTLLTPKFIFLNCFFDSGTHIVFSVGLFSLWYVPLRTLICQNSRARRSDRHLLALQLVVSLHARRFRHHALRQRRRELALPYLPLRQGVENVPRLVTLPLRLGLRRGNFHTNTSATSPPPDTPNASPVFIQVRGGGGAVFMLCMP